MRLFLATVILATTLLSSGAYAHAWMKLRIATTEYAPYTSEKMEYNGYINHIISEAFLETGVTVEFVTLPWDEALEATLKGEYDAISYGNYVRSREDEFWHSNAISTENLVFYVNREKGPKHWESLDDIKPHAMGITEEYRYSNELYNYIEEQGANVKVAETDKENFDALIDGDISVFPIDELTGWYILETGFNDAERSAVRKIEPIVSSVTTHLLVPKGHGDNRLVLELFNKGLEKIKLSGEIERYERLLREGFYQYPDKPVDYDRR